MIDFETDQRIANKVDQSEEASHIQDPDNRKSSFYLRYLKVNDAGYPLYHRLILI
jgi:hypothetical protein